MILCLVDDLMFASKISNAAKGVGETVSFVRSLGAALEAARAHAPRLVVMDLNAARLRPLELVAALQQDPALRSIATLGYVSHVDTAAIDAARTAGVSKVLSRSAFAAQLPDLLGP
jgi:CheY-like chemotaxis protein